MWFESGLPVQRGGGGGILSCCFVVGTPGSTQRETGERVDGNRRAGSPSCVCASVGWDVVCSPSCASW